MVEVFKTDICCQSQATILKMFIQQAYEHYRINFDLQDCDRILRIQPITGAVNSSEVIRLVKQLGFYAEVLPNKPPFTLEETYHF